MKMINDWTPETKSLLTALKAHGFTILSGNDTEEDFKFTGDVLHFIERLTACDEASIHARNPEGKICWMHLFFGNSPGELVSDYSCHPLLDKITDEHFDKWQNEPQPKKEDRR